MLLGETKPMQPNQITAAIIDHSIKIHRTLGPGLLESVYHRELVYELRKGGFQVETEVPVPVHWDGNKIDVSFRADIIVNRSVLVELKSVETISKIHKKQTLTYLKLTNMKLGLLLNFGEALLKDGVHRIVNGLEESCEYEPRKTPK